MDTPRRQAKGDIHDIRRKSMNEEELTKYMHNELIKSRKMLIDATKEAYKNILKKDGMKESEIDKAFKKVGLE